VRAGGRVDLFVTRVGSGLMYVCGGGREESPEHGQLLVRDRVQISQLFADASQQTEGVASRSRGCSGERVQISRLFMSETLESQLLVRDRVQISQLFVDTSQGESASGRDCVQISQLFVDTSQVVEGIASRYRGCSGIAS
jgi:hypothetical protein